MLVIILATISTNTAANIVSPTNDFQNVAPRLINQTKGVLLTGAIGILLMSLGASEEVGAGSNPTSASRASTRTG